MEPLQIDIETLARVLHESGRDAVSQGKVVNKLGQPFKEWDEITEDAREGRRMMAVYLAERYLITPHDFDGRE